MLFNRGSGKWLLAGLAAYAYYKYSKMTPEKKRDLVDKIKGQGRKIYDQFKPANGRESFEPSERGSGF